MKTSRRNFVKQSTSVTTGLMLLPAWSWPNDFKFSSLAQDELLEKLTMLNDQKIETLLPKQINKAGNRWNGGLANHYELPNAHSTTSFIVILAASYASESSVHYRSTILEQPLERAANCLLRVQNEDGSIDLHSTNFQSTPDTAFIVNYLSPAYVCLQRMKQPGLSGFLSQMENFFRKASRCLLVGGIHTPNHRWVVSSALARINAFFPNPKLVDRIDEWLGEGVDLDPDGQYHERSVSVYSPVCNTMFLTIGRLLNRPELLEIVRKNLDMSLYYIQPSGEVLTNASRRQDSAYTGYVKEYYYSYRYFAIKDKNPEFAAVCELIETKMPERITHFLLLLMEDSVFSKPMIAPTKIPDQYFKRFKHSGIFRIRRGRTDISIIEQNPTFLAYRKGNAVLQSMRLGAAFFGRGQFEAQKTEFDGENITLSWTLTKGYYQPIPADRQSGKDDWAKINREERALSEVQTLDMVVKIKESNGRLRIESELKGTPHVPVTWEMSFRPGGNFSGVVPDNNVEDAFFLEQGIGQYQVGEDFIRFGPGNVTHKWSQMRGTLAKQDGKSVYLTGYTPFRHVVELE